MDWKLEPMREAVLVAARLDPGLRFAIVGEDHRNFPVYGRYFERDGEPRACVEYGSPVTYSAHKIIFIWEHLVNFKTADNFHEWELVIYEKGGKPWREREG